MHTEARLPLEAFPVWCRCRRASEDADSLRGASIVDEKDDFNPIRPEKTFPGTRARRFERYS